MIHQLDSKTYKPEFSDDKIVDKDFLITFVDGKILMKNNKEILVLPTYEDIKNNNINILGGEAPTYLFAIDDMKFFLNKEEIDSIQITEKNLENTEFSLESTQIFRKLQPQWMAFAGITGMHLNRFYLNNRYCGKCGKKTTYSDKDRAIICSCGNTVYPPISPAVIVGLIDRANDKILMTKYEGREYKNYALLAGFAEIGEELESTVSREVFEEVGLKVKNISYYKSQPWGFSSSILMGFFAELDGSPTITLDREELSEAGWYSREEIPLDSEPISLTFEMMKFFKEKNI